MRAISIIVMLNVVSIALPSVAQTQVEYADPQGSYRIMPPDEWQIIPKGNGEVEFRYQVFDQNYKPVMWIGRVPSFGVKPIDSEKEKQIQQEIEEGRNEFQLISSERVDLPFGSAYLVTYEHTVQNVRMKTVEAYAVHKGTEYLVCLNAAAPTFDKYYPIYFGSLKTFSPSNQENVALSLFSKKHTDIPLWDRHFEAPDKTFDVRAQSSWAVDDKTDLVIFYPVPQEKQITFSVVKRHKLNPSDLQEWVAETKGVFVTESEKLGYRLSEFERTSVDGRPGLRASFQREKDGIKEKGIVIRVFAPVTDFELNYSVPPDRFDEFIPVFEQFVQSFRVTEK